MIKFNKVELFKSPLIIPVFVTIFASSCKNTAQNPEFICILRRINPSLIKILSLQGYDLNSYDSINF